MPGPEIKAVLPEAGGSCDQLGALRSESGNIVSQGLALGRQILPKLPNSTQ